MKLYLRNFQLSVVRPQNLEQSNSMIFDFGFLHKDRLILPINTFGFLYYSYYCIFFPRFPVVRFGAKTIIEPHQPCSILFISYIIYCLFF